MAQIIGSLTGLAAVLLPVWIVWVVMHYRSRNKSASGFDEEELKQLEELSRIADSMAERIKTLESILDAETPEWRDHHGQD
ncbi:MAG: envelope stress response membrane protein PspB [Pseudomonadales bacterium]|nr:envelope stress response membrane protein PspB [Pseudomonadales bacterium]